MGGEGNVAQISDVKEKLLEDPEKIVELLEEYNFCHINSKPQEIRCSRDDKGGPNISIRLHNNPWINVSDYARGVYTDIFSFIAQERGVTFREVLLSTKKILGLGDDWEPRGKRELFNGIYANIGKNAKPTSTIYDESILNQYKKRCNLRFLKDHISLESQVKFGLMYSVEQQRIIIPIRDIFGNLAGVKSRRNYETDNPDDPKYVFECPTSKSMILYGAYENYSHLMNADKILIFESEKSTCACDSYGYNNAVSIMGNALSSEQAKILLSFNAKEYCFMLDEGLDLNVTLQNAKLLKSFAAMRECKITYFDWQNSLSVGPKESPTDCGKNIFEYIIQNEIENIEKITDDEI